MISSLDVQRELERIADTLRGSGYTNGENSSFSNEKSAQRLSSLVQALTTSSADSDAWIECDLYQIIDPQAIVNRYRYQISQNSQKSESTNQYLETARNVLIFVPIIVTWFGISSAVTAYGNLKHDQLDEPFLYLWQNGFGGRLFPWQTLGVLSAVTIFTVFVIIGLTLVLDWRSHHESRSDEDKAEQLHEELTNALSDAALVLSLRKRQLQTDFTERFDQITTRFDTTARRFEIIARRILKQVEQEQQILSDLVERQKQEAEVFNLFKNDLVQNLQSITAAVQQVEASGRTLNESVNALLTPMQQIVTQQGEFVRKVDYTSITLANNLKLQEQLTNQQQAMTTRLQAVVEKLDSTAETESVALQHYQRALEQQGNILKRMSAQQEQSMQTFRDIQDTLEAHLQKLTLTFANVDASGGMLTESIITLTAGSQTIIEQQNTFIASLKHVGEDLDQILVVQERQVETHNAWNTALQEVLSNLDQTTQVGSKLVLDAQTALQQYTLFSERLVEQQQQEAELLEQFQQNVVYGVEQLTAATSDITASSKLLGTNVALLTPAAQAIVAQQEVLTIRTQELGNELARMVGVHERVVEGQEQWGSDLGSILHTLEDTVQRGAEQTQQIQESINQQTNLSQHLVKHQHKEERTFAAFQQRLGLNVEHLSTVASNIKIASDLLGSNIEPLLPVLQRLGEQNGGIAEQAQQISGRLETIMAAQTFLGERQYAWAEEMPTLLIELKATAQQGSELITESTTLLAQQRELTSALNNSSASQTETLQETQKAQRELASNVEEIQGEIMQQFVSVTENLKQVTMQTNDCVIALDEIRNSMIWLKNFPVGV